MTIANELNNIAVIAPPYVELPNHSYGAIEKVSWDRSITLTKLGHTVTLFAPFEHAPKEFSSVHLKKVGLIPNLTRKNIFQWMIDSRSIGYSLAYLKPKVNEQFDIVINDAWRIEPWIISTFALKFGVSKTINIIHSPGLSFNSVYARIEEPILSRLNFGCLNTEMHNDLNSKSLKSCYFPNGVKIPNERAQDPGDYMIFVGRMDRFKNPAVAIELANRWSVKLRLVGPIKDIEYFKGEIKPRLDDNVVYMGELDDADMRATLAKSFALCYVATDNDPQPTVVMEANSYGVPVACVGSSHFNGVNDMLLDGTNGIKLDKHLSQATSKSLSELISLNRTQIKNYAKMNWSWEAVYSKHWVASIESVCAFRGFS